VIKGDTNENNRRNSVDGLMLTVGGGVATAGPFEDASAAYERGEYATALRLLRPLAEQGDAKAQYKIGLMCEEGGDCSIAPLAVRK